MSSGSVSPIIYLYNNKSLNVDGLTPLWSTFERDQQNEFYEFEVLADGNDNVGEDVRDLDELLNMTTYKCHICNIEVPKSYSEEHKQSPKHVACLKITNLALERTSLLINSDAKETIVKFSVENTHYCESCATIIKTTEKNNHELTERHINSIKYDMLLQKLVDMYGNPKIDKVLFEDLDCIDLNVKPENDETTVEQTNETNKSCDEQNSNMNEKKDSIKVDSENPLSKQNEASLENVTATKEELNNKMQNPKKKKKKVEIEKESAQDTRHENDEKVVAKSTSVEINTKPTDNNDDTKEFEELKTYLEMASNKHTITHTVAALSKSTVKITASNGDVVNIPVVNFQGFFVAEKNYSCTLCQITVKIDDKSHAWTEEHLKKITASIEDKHCLRKVSDSCTHCLLCNSLRQSTEQTEHIKTTCHLANLKKYFASPNNASGALDQGTTIIRNSNRVLGGNITNFLTRYNLEMTDDGAVFCKSCQIQIKNDKQVVTKHAYSPHHRQCNVSSLITENDLVLLKNGQYRCKPCGKDLYPYFLKTHCSYKQHKKKLKDIEKNRN